MSENVIEIRGLSKKYMRGEIGTGTLSHDIHRFINKYIFHKNEHDKINNNKYETIKNTESWALQDISLDISQGSKLGIIGRNGAGKSTLLKLISRITSPTTGEIRVRGKVATLLEIGTGMHPEMTGRENIYLNGVLLGMSKKQVSDRLDEIIDYSGVEKYIDTPVKRYSSGMKTRLGFAVAAHMSSDILIVDEVLAVGDLEFQKKCIGKMNDVAREGRTVLFVSHNLGAVRQLCSEAIVIDEGKLQYQGVVDDAIERYMSGLVNNTTDSSLLNHTGNDEKPIYISSVSMEQNLDRQEVEYDSQIRIKLGVTIREANTDYYAIALVHDAYGNNIIFTSDEDWEESTLSITEAGDVEYLITLPAKLLKPGQYYLTVAACEKNIGKIDRHDAVLSFMVIDTKTRRGERQLYRKGCLVAPECTWQTIN